MSGVTDKAELLLRDDRAVMVRRRGEGGRETRGGTAGVSAEADTVRRRNDARSDTAVAEGGDLDDLVGAELAEALDEWARVCAALVRTGGDAGREVVSRRGRQLVSRVATVLGEPVRYRDPMTDETAVVHPPSPGLRRAAPPPGPSRHHPAARSAGPAPPWGTGLTAAGFVAVFVIVAMLALAQSLASETMGWVAVLAAAVVTGGLAPSLWLGRTVPVVRWVVLGAVVGMALSWVGVLFVAFS